MASVSSNAPSAGKGQPSVWPARLWMSAGTLAAALLGGAFLFIPNIASVTDGPLGGKGNTLVLGVGAAFVAVVMAIALVLGWLYPYKPPKRPSHTRKTLIENQPGLRSEKILEEEYEYAAQTAEQAMEHRMTLVNFYLLIAGGAGSGVVALLTGRPEVAGAAVPLLWVISVVGGLILLQLIALRKAWAGSVMQMNYIKEFFIVNADAFSARDLADAFLWSPLTIPDTHRKGNVFHYSALLIALLDVGAFLGGLFALGLTTHAVLTAPASVVLALLLGALLFGGHMWVFDMQLIPTQQPQPSAPSVQQTNFVSPVVQPNTVISTREIFKGRVVTLRVDDVRLPDGTTGVREIVQHAPAVVIAPYLEDSDEFVFIEQYRDALGKALVELPAGMISPGEDPAAAARRELWEETGYEAGALRYLGPFYTSPGFTDEVLHLFLATQLHQVSGIQDTHEIAALHRISRAEALRQITARQISDGKTIIGLLWSDHELPTRV